ncbi:unnamed protein product [Cladocopium goreaui]|uniref:Uncharacterized protein n=1 Tax=Cladocopium goreaui TaxID=2562237 RepID=A0A9P1D1K5_9DINO|nr:unnamed protein product [Cladocopium goreaui]
MTAKAKAADRAADFGHSGTLFAIIKELTQVKEHRRSFGFRRDEDPAGEAEAWKQHFEHIQSGVGQIPDEVWRDITPLPVTADWLSSPPTPEEIQKSINDMSTGKAPNSDLLMAEFLKYGGPALRAELAIVISQVWQTAQDAEEGSGVDDVQQLTRAFLEDAAGSAHDRLAQNKNEWKRRVQEAFPPEKVHPDREQALNAWRPGRPLPAFANTAPNEAEAEEMAAGSEEDIGEVRRGRARQRVRRMYARGGGAEASRHERAQRNAAGPMGGHPAVKAKARPKPAAKRALQRRMADEALGQQVDEVLFQNKASELSAGKRGVPVQAVRAALSAQFSFQGNLEWVHKGLRAMRGTSPAAG